MPLDGKDSIQSILPKVLDDIQDDEQEGCYVSFAENILITCENGMTMIDRLDNFIFPTDQATTSSTMIIQDNVVRNQERNVINNERFTTVNIENQGYVTYEYDSSND